MRPINRRHIGLGLLCLPIAGCMLPTQDPAPLEEPWVNHFKNLDTPSILVDTQKRRLHFWDKNNSRYRAFPIGVPRNTDLTRIGSTTIVRKTKNPDWRPTPNMLKENPNLPTYVPAGPNNPLGTHALYLNWTYYAIHGTNDPVSVGRRTTSGCFRLLPKHITWLYENAPIGSIVKVI